MRGADEHDVFRLYTASTPSAVRLSAAVTLPQWAASREPVRGRTREFVLERAGGLAAWVMVARRAGRSMALFMVHPDHESEAEGLVDFALGELPDGRPVACLTQEHQTVLQRLLWQRDFEAEAHYDTLVRSMVAAVRDEKPRGAVTIAST
jgi:hypothetical protein